MEERKDKIVKIIDKSVYVFFIIFLLSLTNSIFLNQVGYYASLLLLLVRYAITRENPFRKTGAEYFFLLFILAEVLSTIFSASPAASFNNLLKRVLLIPVVYTTISASDSFKNIKTFIYVFIGAALAGMVIYLFNAYYYVVYNLYQTMESGPSLFQYPITASEIMSFVAVLLFAFLINEKQTRNTKLLTLILFGISVLALFSTYKRTGWIGTVAGIFAIILIKKNLKLLIPLLILVIAVIVLEKGYSKVGVYPISDVQAGKGSEISTQGRALDVYNDGRNIRISDFDNGILVLNGDKITYNKKLSAPVEKLQMWKDNIYVAYLVDTRFVILKKDEQGRFNYQNEIVSSGFTASFDIANGNLYVMDRDSGLTVYTDPNNPSKYYRFPEILASGPLFADSSRLVYNEKGNGLAAFTLVGGLPASKKVLFKASEPVNHYFYSDSRLLAAGENGLKLYDLSNDSMVIESVFPHITSVYMSGVNDGRFFACTHEKQLFLLNSKNGEGNATKVLAFSDLPKDIAIKGDTVYAAYYKMGRIRSIFDPYNKSNFARLALWSAGWKMFIDHPVLGVGDIDLAALYKQYKNTYDKEIQGHLHNNYFHILAILGGFGFIVVMGLLIKIMLINFRIYNLVKDEAFASSFSLGVIGIFISFLTAGLTEWNFGDHEIITMLWFIFGLNVALFRSKIKTGANI